MNKMLLSLFTLYCGSVYASGYYSVQTNNCNIDAMRVALDRATVDGRAVITSVQCDSGATNSNIIKSDASQNFYSDFDYIAPEIELVTDRKYYVVETVQKYRPVVQYIPSGTYTQTSIVCDDSVCK